MQVFFRSGVLLTFCLLLSFPGWGQTEELGQERLIRAWHEAVEEGREGIEAFESQFVFEDVLEAYWLKRLQKQPPRSTPAHPKAALSHLRHQFSSSPLTFWNWLPTLFEVFQGFFQRPFESLYETYKIATHFFVPILLALFLLSLSHLKLWLPAIQTDLNKSGRARARWLTPVSFLIGLALTVYTGLWSLLLLLMFCLFIAYSRRKHFPTFVAICIALTFSSPLWLEHLKTSTEQMLAVEALEKGRSKLHYSQTSLEALEFIEQAYWAYYNQDSRKAQTLLNRAKDSTAKQQLQAVLSHNPAQLDESIKTFEKLREDDPKNAITLFNLSQLYMRNQQLVEADRRRSAVPQGYYDQLLEKAEERDQMILPAEIKLPYQRFFQLLFENAKKLRHKPWQFWLWAMLIWCCVIIGLYLRKRTSGMCRETGLATPSVEHDISPTAQLLQERSSTIEPKQKQEHLQKVRIFEIHKQDIALNFSWIFPGSYAAIYQESFLKSFLQALLVYSIIWIALPYWLREQILRWIEPSIAIRFQMSSYSITLLTVGLILWLFLLWHNRKKVQA